MKQKISLLSIVFFVITVILNYIFSAGILKGFSPQKLISEKYPTPITPAGFTFSIWGVIYASLLVALLFLYINSKAAPSKSLDKRAPILWGIFLANIVWNLLFCKEFIVFSAVDILFYLLLLLIFTRIISKGKKSYLSNSRNKAGLYEILKFAFGIHLGWIILASLVNIYAALTSINIDVFSRVFIISGVIIVSFLSIIFTRYTENAYLLIATIWGFWGIKNNGNIDTFEGLFIIFTIFILVVFFILELKRALKHS